jgi:hypothetical protein
MSKYRLSKIIQAEINKLNEEIDLRIIRGLSYKTEARRHKFLLSQLRDLERKESYRATPPQARWFEKTLKYSSAFMF